MPQPPRVPNEPDFAASSGGGAPGPLKLVIWTFMPTHHQSDFFAALRASGVQLEVCYLQQVSAERRLLGWQVPAALPDGERYVAPGLRSLRLVDQWLDRVHLVAGVSTPLLRRLALRLSLRRAVWLHWSEAASPRPGWHPRNALRRVYATLVNRCAAGAFAIGETARRDFVAWGVDPRRIRFLPYSVAPLDPQPPSHEAGRSVRFVQVGELCARKGVDVLIKACAGLFREFPTARLTLVGGGASERECRALAAGLGIEHAVEFAGVVPAPTVAGRLRAAQVAVLASRFDGWGVVLNEAASLGRALISTEATGAAHHLIVDGRNGYRVPAGDVDALRAAMRRYCLAPGLAAGHGRESWQIFQDYTPAANVARLRAGLRSLEAGGAGAAPW